MFFDIWIGVGFGIIRTFAWVGGQLIPGKEFRFCVIGTKASGKTHCHACMDRKGKAVMLKRKPTLAPGRPVRNKWNMSEVTKRKLFWLHRDMPHNASYVTSYIMEELPDVIFWILATDTWDDDYNLTILKTLHEVLTSEDYDDCTLKTSRTLPIKFNLGKETSWKQTSGKKGTRCKKIVMMLNKMDAWLEVKKSLTAYEQIQKFDEVKKWYENHEVAGPLLDELKEKGFDIEFLPISFQRGNCLEQDNLGGKPTKITHWVHELAKATV